MKKYLIIFFITIIIVYICNLEAHYLVNLCIITIYMTGVILFLKKNYKEENYENKNNNIIAAITHDLKTPTVAQIRALELILKGNFGEITDLQRTFLNDILSSCNTMLDMLVNMLWLYKFDNRMVALNICSFCVNDLINEILKENKLLLNSKKQNIEQNLKTAKIYLSADKMHIKRIISNLITNAIHYSKENSTILIETFIKDNTFTFQVKNEGRFLDDELLKCMFDKNKIFTRKSDGLSTGLGLYLSKSLLELNGGEIMYKSEPNGINTFGFHIKLNHNSRKSTSRKDIQCFLNKISS